MNYAIQSETCTFPYLQVTARKRTSKHSLIQ
ncbi:MAG: AraC family transcriptional regulator, partial [Vibrio metschnikovii]